MLEQSVQLRKLDIDFESIAEAIVVMIEENDDFSIPLAFGMLPQAIFGPLQDQMLRRLKEVVAEQNGCNDWEELVVGIAEIDLLVPGFDGVKSAMATVKKLASEATQQVATLVLGKAKQRGIMVC